MNKKLGISINPEVVGEIKTLEYIKKSRDAGFSKVFVSLKGIKNNLEGNKKLKVMKRILAFISASGMKSTVIVDKEFYKTFDLAETEVQFFKALNVSTVRFASQIDNETKSLLTFNTHNIKFDFSVPDLIKNIDVITEKGFNPANTEATHAFYPLKYSGIDINQFISVSSQFRAKEIKVNAFVTLPAAQKPIGLENEKTELPTLESHRNLSVEEQIKNFLDLDVVDGIIVAQYGLTDKQFKKISEMLKIYKKVSDPKEQIMIRINLKNNIGNIEKHILKNNYGKEHASSNDFNKYSIRSKVSSEHYFKENIKPNNSGQIFKRGDVVILNNNMKEFKGELHIMLSEMDDKKEKGRNLIGKIIPEDLWKLDLVKKGREFKIIIK